MFHRCSIDVSQLKGEKTHDMWLELECGYGSLHLLITVSGTGRQMPADNIPTTNCIHNATLEKEDFVSTFKFALFLRESLVSYIYIYILYYYFICFI
jgi:hypothetical protein